MVEANKQSKDVNVKSNNEKQEKYEKLKARIVQNGRRANGTFRKRKEVYREEIGELSEKEIAAPASTGATLHQESKAKENECKIDEKQPVPKPNAI